MQITYDPTKDAMNQVKHGPGLIGNRVYAVVYVIRDRSRRVISLRKANHREVISYVDQA